jgi:hypothetical protein
MADLTYLCLKNCSCCGVRLNTIKKTCIRRINDEILMQKVNSVKNKILYNKKKEPDNNLVNIGDIICETCRSYAKKYGTNENVASSSHVSKSLSTTTIIPVASTSKGKSIMIIL